MRFLMFFAMTGVMAAQQPCANLTRLKLPGVTVTAATAVPAGNFDLPGGRGGNSVNVPAFCRVAATANQEELQFELWMPEQWNRKLLAVGNGGLAGTIAYAAMGRPLERGYATSSTDTGHQATSTNDGTWALGHYERIVNFADRATHLMAAADKAILTAFYGDKPQHAYFTGCSQGGHEAMIEAQRYPEDFDGIIAGDPANYWTHHYAGGHLYSGVVMDGDGYIPASKVQIIGDAVNEQCDMLDGVRDGVLTDPRRCHFDPAKLQCASGDGPSCLTAAQVSSVRKLWTGLRTKDGDQVYPGLVPGGGGGARWPGRTGLQVPRPAAAVTQIWATRFSNTWFSTIPIGISAPSSSTQRMGLTA